MFSIFFFFNDTATTEIYTLSLHDALPISGHLLGWVTFTYGDQEFSGHPARTVLWALPLCLFVGEEAERQRSEEHTSELQSRPHLVCRLLLEKKKRHTRHSPKLQFTTHHRP